MVQKISRGWKVIIILSIVLILALTCVNFFASWYVKKRLRELSFTNKPNGYQLQFDNLWVNIFTGTITGANIHIRSAPTPSIDATRKLDFKANSVTFSGIDLYCLFFKRTIHISELRVQNPATILRTIHSKRSPGNKTSGKKATNKNITLFDVIHPKFDKLYISKLEVKGGSIKTIGHDSSDFYLASDSFSFEANDLFADSTTSQAGKIFGIGHIALSIKNIRGIFTRGLYHLTIPLLTMDTKDSTLVIDSVLLLPTVDKRQFSKKLGYQVSCMTLLLANVRIYSGKLGQFIEQRDLLIDTLEIGYAKIHKYRDKNIPRKFVYHPLHHTFLASRPFKIDVGKIKILDAESVSESLSPGATEPHQINFENVKAEISNFSNIDMNDTMKVYVECAMLSEAALKIKVLLPLRTDEFYLTGSMGPFDMRIWNPVLKDYSPPVLIKSGYGKSITFSCYANEKNGSGTMTFIYSDFIIRLLNKEKEPGGITNSLKSFLANKLIVVKENPDGNTLRIGKIEFTREPGKSMISYVWHLIFSGMKSSVGLQEEKMEKELPDYNSKN